jgi:hypothetical protein
MKRILVALLAIGLVAGFGGTVPADDAADAKAIVDKAIKALGGEEALGKAKIAYWKSKTTISFNGNDNEGESETTVQGLNHFRQVFTGEFGGNKFKGVTVVAGDTGKRKFGENATELKDEALAGQKRSIYLTMIPVTMLPLKDSAYKLEPIAEEKFEDKPVVGLKVTAPDKKDFKIYFDKESGLPVRVVAKVSGFQPGMEFTQDTRFSDYKDTAGIKKAMKTVSKRDGEKFMTQTITEFKVLDKVEPKVFTEVE